MVAAAPSAATAAARQGQVGEARVAEGDAVPLAAGWSAVALSVAAQPSSRPSRACPLPSHPRWQAVGTVVALVEVAAVEAAVVR